MALLLMIKNTVCLLLTKGVTYVQSYYKARDLNLYQKHFAIINIPPSVLSQTVALPPIHHLLCSRS